MLGRRKKRSAWRRVESLQQFAVCLSNTAIHRPPNMTKDQEKKDETGTKAASDGTEAKGAEAAPAPATEAIEEDDAFEEFEPSAWGAHDEEAEDVQQWQDNWDDDDIEDDFTKSLRAELTKNA